MHPGSLYDGEHASYREPLASVETENSIQMKVLAEQHIATGTVTSMLPFEYSKDM